MCGIVGVINGKQKGPKYYQPICQAMDDMVWADQLRGQDGIGVMCLDEDGKFDLAKVGGGYSNLKDNKIASKILNFTDTNLFTIAHNRSATSGEKHSAVNAHPFKSEHIALVHNGTLYNISHKFKDSDTKTDVDSKAACKAIAQLGIDEAINEFNGAYAFVYIDTKNMTLNVLRNDQRPLGFIKLHNYILLASEPALAVWTASRHGIPFPDNSKMEMFEKDQLYTWEPETLEFTKRPVVKKVKTYSYPSYHDYDDGVAYSGERVGSTSFCGGSGSGSSSRSDSSRSRLAKKERIRLLSPNSPECPYTVGEKVGFYATAANAHKNLCRITAGEFFKPHAGVKDRHRVMGNVKMDICDIVGDEKPLTGVIAACYKTDNGFFVFELKDIEPKKASVIVLPAPAKSSLNETLPTPDEKDTSKVVDISTGDKTVSCDCCGVLTPDSKLSTKKRTITDTATGTRVKLSFRVCPSCDVQMTHDSTLLTTLSDKRVAELRGAVQ